MTEPEQNPEPPKPLVQRDAKGHLLPGSKLALGTKGQTKTSKIRAAFLEAVENGNLMAKVLRRHVELLMQATPKEAAPLLEILYAYGMGKPKESMTVDVNTDHQPRMVLPLDPMDLTALEAIRSKLSIPTGDEPLIDAEVVQVQADEPPADFLQTL